MSDNIDNHKLQIKKYIDSNQYFKDGLLWYNKKYKNIFKSYFMVNIIFTIYLLIFAIVAYKIYSYLPLVERVKYFIEDDDKNKQDEFVRELKKVKIIKNDAFQSLASFLLQEYIEKRESYKYDRLKNQFYFVQNNSTKSIFEEFYRNMDVINIDSPILKYKKDFYLKVSNVKTRNISRSKASYDFDVNIYNTQYQIIETKKYKVDMSYQMNDLNSDFEKNNKFNFIVTSYKLTEIGG